jgi:hypothetical protein
MGLGIFKSLLDTAKVLKDASDAAVRNAVAIELQEKILAAQEQQAALLERVSDLETEVASFKAWEAEKQRYDLTDYGGGTFAYALKAEASGSEPPHRICAACYQKGHKSILQNLGGVQNGRERYKCPSCETVFNLGTYVAPPSIAQTGRRINRSGWLDRA